MIKAIIFDLGKVIIDLNEDATVLELRKISKSTGDIKSWFGKKDFFEKYEVGAIDDDQFLKEMRAQINNHDITSGQITTAWNAMLGNIDKELIERIKEIKERFSVFVLSNTNAIHERAFNRILLECTGHATLKEIFDAVYFSHHINYRKPDLRPWKLILKENELRNPSEVLFLDDRAENTGAAASIGLKAMQIREPSHTMEILQQWI